MSSLPQTEVFENLQPESLAKLRLAAVLWRTEVRLPRRTSRWPPFPLSKVQPWRARKRLAWSLFIPSRIQQICCGSIEIQRTSAAKKGAAGSGGESRPRANPVGDGEGWGRDRG